MKKTPFPKWLIETLQIVILIAILYAAYILAGPFLGGKPVSAQTWLYYPVQIFVALIAVGAYRYWKESQRIASEKAKKEAELREQRRLAESKTQHEANIKRNQNVQQNLKRQKNEPR
ncbi:hypothetical protein LOSG293_190260 [Secundilactobacillus oryzae JCM 18671]|uniref:Uncharacterized protein n=1 Tax=Secundilactobacillus oryzae JCM 18671 TaxID=1291743 RepID=A0A081BJA1_9LACO|nr:ABC transporter permease [Secundilactobacillus oryzae]GAK48119.1 hypothetical protein LOSG293_190260 [Secundilactobacillus oryzae JCM 18671]